MLYLVITFGFFIAALLVARHVEIGIPESILMVLVVAIAWPLLIIIGLFWLVFDCFYQAYRLVFGEEKL